MSDWAMQAMEYRLERAHRIISALQVALAQAADSLHAVAVCGVLQAEIAESLDEESKLYRSMASPDWEAP